MALLQERWGEGGRRKELTYVRSLNFITRNFAHAGEAVSLLYSLPREERCVTTLKTAVEQTGRPNPCRYQFPIVFVKNCNENVAGKYAKMICLP